MRGPASAFKLFIHLRAAAAAVITVTRAWIVGSAS
jgi:hypothetical protein